MINRRTALKTIGLTTAAVAGGLAVGVNQKPGEAAPTPEKTELLPALGVQQAGIITAQPPAVLLVALEVLSNDRQELTTLFKTLTGRVQALMQGQLNSADEGNANFPPQNTGEMGFDTLKTGQLSIMVAVGASLFTNASGIDRFGLTARKPLALKAMPTDLAGDQLLPNLLGGDIFLQISSDHPLLNLHAIRDILLNTRGQLKSLWMQPGFQRLLTTAPGEADTRGLFGFKDGTANLDTNDTGLMSKLVWTGQEEPQWAQGGTYVAVRIIREQLERWDRLALGQQEAVFGRSKKTGAVLGQTQETQPPNYAADPNGQQVPLNSHIRKANPRLGQASEQRRFLRRGYLYFNGLDNDGLLDAGFLFMGFCRNVEQQFEYVKRQYMNNHDFPKLATGSQSLDEHMNCIGGGYFYVLPGLPIPDRFLADALLA